MALRDQPYLPLYVQDFLTDEKLIECSASSTGVYIRLMCIMHKSEPYGSILLKQKYKQSIKQTENFANQLAKSFPYEFAIVLGSINELVEEGVLIIDGDLLIQKRMAKDCEISVKRAEAGKKGGKKTHEFAKAKNKANTEYEVESVSENEIESEIVNKPRQPKILEVVWPFDSDEFKGAWQIWLRYKKEQHSFNYKSTISLQAALKDLAKISGGNEQKAIELIHHAISKGWKGIFKADTNGQQSGQTRQLRNGIFTPDAADRISAEFDRLIEIERAKST